MFASGFILTRPWGLFSDDEKGFRHELRPGRLTIRVAGGKGLWAIAPKRLRISFQGRRLLNAQEEGGAFAWSGEERQFWTLPIGSATDEERFRLVFASADQPSVVAEIWTTGACARPNRPGMST